MHIFLFTDIEASTVLWEQHGEHMSAAITRHDEILRACIARARGEVIKQLGDGVFAAFDEHGDPLRCALDIQQVIYAADWSAIGRRLQVRIALNAGREYSSLEDGDYLGLAVNRAAHLLRVAHGGQILCTYEVIRACRVPPLATMRNLGWRSLKEDTNPLQLYELVHPDLAERGDARPGFVHERVSAETLSDERR